MDPIPLRPLQPPLSDEALVARIRGGEPQLFELLMRRHNARLYRAVRSLLRDEQEVEDAMQDAYVRAFTHLGSFRQEARLSTWLTRIALNEALMRLRRRHPTTDLYDDLSEESAAMSEPDPSRPSPEQAAQTRELRELLEASVDALSASCRTAFVLRDVEGMSTEEAAQALGISEESVRTRLHRARAQLREELFARAGSAAGELFTFHASRCDRVVAAVLARLPN